MIAVILQVVIKIGCDDRDDSRMTTMVIAI